MKVIIAIRLTVAVSVALGTSSAYSFADPGSARPLIDPATYVLHGSGPFSNSVAAAVVSRLGNDRFRLSLIAEHLPPPTILHERFARHAYVVWLVNGSVMHGPPRMAAVGLAVTGRAGNYAGVGTVTIGGVTSVIITAELTERAHMPIMPVLTVLASADHQM